jgi:FkbM family methyltransferase
LDPDLVAQLEELLSETRESVVERERSTFDRLAGPLGESIVLFGAGGAGLTTLAGLRSLGIEPLAFSDNSPSLWGTTIEGLPVLNPETAVRDFGDSAVFVTTIFGADTGHPTTAIEAQLNAIAPTRVVSLGSLYWKYPDTFLPYYFLDLPHKVIDEADEIRKGLDLWADDESRAEYVAQIRCRLWLTWDELPAVAQPDEYFPVDIPSVAGPEKGEVYVDCGAFDGDTIREYLAHRGIDFAKIIAFEPDPANFEQLRTHTRSLRAATGKRIEIIQAAVSDRAGTVTFDARGGVDSRIGDSRGIEVRTETVDRVLDPSVPTYIKMDIEGAELDALHGAVGTIAKGTARFAVCVYHRLDHLWGVPNVIRANSGQYRFFLRRYRSACWETICYAVPTERKRATSPAV